MGEHNEPPLSAAEAKQLAREHLTEDHERWGVIKPLTLRLKALRTEDRLSEAMAEEWGRRRR